MPVAESKTICLQEPSHFLIFSHAKAVVGAESYRAIGAEMQSYITYITFVTYIHTHIYSFAEILAFID